MHTEVWFIWFYGEDGVLTIDFVFFSSSVDISEWTNSHQILKEIVNLIYESVFSL